MYIKSAQRFISIQSGVQIKVTKIERSMVDSKYDRCTVSNTNQYGRVDSSTRRVIQADSIRRRYF